jgi:hypothetical protein
LTATLVPPMSTQATGAAPLGNLKPLINTFEFMVFFW